MTAQTTSTARAVPRPVLLGGLAGSTLVAVGGLGAGATPVDGGWPSLPRTVGTLLVVAGVLLLVTSWWRVRRVLDVVTSAALLRLTALWSLPLLAAPPMFSRDVYSYAGQALLVVRGLDPYEVGPTAAPGQIADNVDDVWLDTPAPYGPAFLGPASLLVRLTGDDVVPAVLLLRLLAVLGLVLTAIALPVLARACGVPAQRALWLGLVNPLGLLHGVAGAHNDALMVGLMLTGVALATRLSSRSFAVAGALVALAGLVKAPALGALPFLVLLVPELLPRLRAAAALAAGAVATAVAVTAVAGLGWGWIGALDAGRARASLFSPTTGLGTALDRLGLVDVDAVLAAGVVLALLIAAVLLVRAARGPATPRTCVQALGLALLAVVVLSPTVLPWYLLWAVVPLAAAVGPRAATALGGMCLVLCLTTWPSGRGVVRPPLYGLPLLLAAAGSWVATRRPG